MAANSDDFFNNWEHSPNPPARAAAPPPPQGSRRGPPPGPPPAYRPQRPPPPRQAQPPQRQQAAAAAAAPPPQQQQQQPASSYYGGGAAQPQQPPQQQQPQYAAPQQTNDWYSPQPSMTAPQSHMAASLQQQQQPPYGGMPAAAPAPYNATMQGSMDASGRSVGSDGNANINNSGGAFGGMMQPQQQQPQMFVPQAAGGSSSMANNGDLDDLANEPPLLEELGVNVEHILMKTKAVVIPFRRWNKTSSALADPSMIVQDADLAGPLAFALLLGGELLMTGKLQFGYVYGFGMFGCLAMTGILNLMSPTNAISLWTVMSILGYSLLPVNILAAIKIILFSLPSVVRFLAVLTVIWSTTASTRLLEIGCGLENQRYLLAYPIALLYSAFVLITIF